MRLSIKPKIPQLERPWTGKSDEEQSDPSPQLDPSIALQQETTAVQPAGCTLLCCPLLERIAHGTRIVERALLISPSPSQSVLPF